jgi:23S rRNA maturation mini-RNase III
MNTTPNSGSSGENSRQRVGRYVLGVGFTCLIGALYVADQWRLALWLASIGVITAYVGAMLTGGQQN